MKEITVEKRQALENDLEFLAAMKQVKTAEEAVQILAGYGIEATAEELEQGCAEMEDLMIRKGYMEADGEMTLEGLDLVSGGARNGVSLVGAVMGAASFAVGGPIGVGLFFGGAQLLIGGQLLPSKKKKAAKKSSKRSGR